MSTSAMTRRCALRVFAAATLSPVMAVAQPVVRFRSIAVDVAPLRANGGDPTAAWVEEALSESLPHEFGPSLTPLDQSGAMLVARVDFLYLGPSSGGTGPRGSSQDTIAGVLLAHDPRGFVAAETSLRATSNFFPNGVDQPLRFESNHDRIVALAQAFAYWAPRELGL